MIVMRAGNQKTAINNKIRAREQKCVLFLSSKTFLVISFNDSSSGFRQFRDANPRQ